MSINLFSLATANALDRKYFPMKKPSALSTFTKLVVISLLAISSAAWAASYEVVSKNKMFSVKALQIKIGDSVSFKNGDPYNHNIFSLSDAKSFDLGSYPQGQSRTVVFDKLGTVEVECSIHPDEKMTITAKY